MISSSMDFVFVILIFCTVLYLVAGDHVHTNDQLHSGLRLNGCHHPQTRSIYLICTSICTSRQSPYLTSFHGAVAKGVACNQETLTLPGHLVSLRNDIHSEARTEYNVDIRTEVQLRFATTDVIIFAMNKGPQTTQFVYQQLIPSEAFVSNFSMKVSNRLYQGQIAERKPEFARNKQQRLDISSDVHRLKIKAPLPSNGNTTLYLTYQQVLHRRKGRIPYELFLQHMKPERINLNIMIREPRDLISLKTNISGTERVSEFTVYRPQQNVAHLSYVGSNCNEVPNKVIITYDMERGNDGGDLFIEDSYFTHLFSPIGLRPIPKDIIFVLDVSGSMTGNKMNKLKAAMFEILEALQDGDRFGIISFESRSTFMNQQYLFVSANLTKSFAKHHVDSFVAGGGTNIKDALIDAIQFLNRFDSSRRSHIIFFLTDGAIYKQKNETLQAIRNANINDIPIFSLVFGNNTDDDFVRKMVAQNQGSLQRVYDNDKSDQQISGFYDEVAVTLLKDLEFVYPNGSSNVTVAKFARYLDGSELRISGKITESNISSSLFNASITGVSLDDDFDIQIEGKDISTLHNKSDMANPAQQRPSLEKMWAFMTVKEKLRELSSRVLYPSERDELRKNILDLSLKYGLLTPLTQLTVETDNVNSKNTGISLDSNDVLYTSDESSYKPKQYYGGGGDPHFVATVPGLMLPICFDISFPRRTAVRLVENRSKGLIINAGMVTSPKRDKQNKRRSYIGEIHIIYPHLSLLATKSQVILNGKELDFVPSHHSLGSVHVDIMKHAVHIGDSDGTLYVIRRMAQGKHSLQYLNFEVIRPGVMRKHSNGLLGQLVSRETTFMYANETNIDTRAILRTVIDQKHVHFSARLIRRHDFIRPIDFSCWQVYQNKKGILDKAMKYYRVPTLLYKRYLVT